MIIIIGEMTVAAEQAAAMSELVQPLVEASRAEPGCLAYSFAQDVCEPGMFRISEEWADDDALTAHFGTDHFRSFQRNVRNAGVVATSVVRHDVATSTKLA